jgi:hypothetical protein
MMQGLERAPRTAGWLAAICAVMSAAPFGASASELALARATDALERFRDVDMARDAGYRKPGRNDGFMMGEHWYQPELLAAGECRLESPAFLQYLVIDGRRTLIGTGYVCDLERGEPPDWFGSDVVWHTHGPAVCRFRRGAFIDAQYFAESVPNAVNDATWQQLCDRVWGEPEERAVAMLHTWNWIPHPDGALVHENRAIPFLRAGLRVPVREELDSPVGRDAVDTLRLAQGDAGRRYEGAFLVIGWGFFDKWQPRRLLRRYRKRGEEALAQMREAERLEDRGLYAAAARSGAAALAELRHVMAHRFDSEERSVERWLASLTVHDHPGAKPEGDAHMHH